MTSATAARASRAARGAAAARVRTSRGPQRERHEPDYVVLVTIVALAALGILMVYSSSGVQALLTRHDPFAVVGPQAMWAVLGVVAMGVIMRVDYRYMRLLSIPAMVVTLLLLVLVLLPAMGPVRPLEINGATRWLQIGPLPAMHPAEFAKLALVIYLAHWLARRGARAGSLLHGLLPFLLIAGPVLALVLLEPDLGTTGVLALTAFTMFFVAGGSLWQMALLAPAGVAAVAYVVTHSDYQLARVQAFLDPWADPQGNGYQTIQSLIALASGGPLGVGLGASRQKWSYVPNAHTDFIFSIIGEELGLIGAIVVLVLFGTLIYAAIRIAVSAPDAFGRLLAAGITGWFGVQALANLGAVTGVLPITGVPLPFVSFGGSSLVVSLLAVGILRSIGRGTREARRS